MNHCIHNESFKTVDDCDGGMLSLVEFEGAGIPCRRLLPRKMAPPKKIALRSLVDGGFLPLSRPTAGLREGINQLKAWDTSNVKNSYTWEDAAFSSFDESTPSTSATQALEELTEQERRRSASKRSQSFGLLDTVEIEDSLTSELATKLSTKNNLFTSGCKRQRRDSQLRRVKRCCSDMFQRQATI